MIYIASPYSHPSAEVRAERYRAARAYTWLLLGEAQACFSPVVYGHQFALTYAAPQDHDFWKRINITMLCQASAMHVLALDGWRESFGIQHERMVAEALELPITIITGERLARI